MVPLSRQGLQGHWGTGFMMSVASHPVMHPVHTDTAQGCGAYDGKGNAVVANAAGIPAAWEKLGGKAGKRLCCIEQMVARGTCPVLNA